MILCKFKQKWCHISGLFIPDCPCRSTKNKAKLVISWKIWLLHRDWSVICQLKLLQIKCVQFSPRCRKPHVKGQYRYGLICFCPLHLTCCLHVANDFRVYSQMSLPIWRLSRLYTVIMPRPPCETLDTSYTPCSRDYCIYLGWLETPITPSLMV